MRVLIVQCLCGPNRHALIASATNPERDGLTAEQASAALQHVVAAVIAGHGDDLHLPRQLNPWCGLCGAPAHAWRYEAGWSIEFPDWDTAVRHIQESSADQERSAALLHLLDMSYDAKHRRDPRR